MIKFAFRNWLTFQQAAEYLTEVTGKKCSEELIEEAAYSGAITAYYYTPSHLGLYIEERIKTLYNETGNIYPAESPDFFIDNGSADSLIATTYSSILIPIQSYRQFRIHTPCTHKPSYPIGITVYDKNINFLGGVYCMDENSNPTCTVKAEHHILVARTQLDDLIKLPVHKWLHHEVAISYMGIVPSGKPVNEEAIPYFVNPIDIPTIDPHLKLELENKNTQPGVPEKENGLLSAQKALAIAVHLIADLSTSLDATAESQNKAASQRNDMQKKNGDPTTSKISERMAETAKRKKITERGYSAGTFQKTIAEALAETGL